MNSKSIFKNMLPIAIALIVILIATVVGAAIASDKKVPGFSDKNYGKEDFITYTTASGEKISLSRNAVYDALRGTTSSSSVVTDTTVTELVNLIDKQLLASYVSNVDAKDVCEAIEKQIFSATLADYVENNEATLKVTAHKEGKSFSAYLNEIVEEKISDYVKTLKYSYGIKSDASEYTFNTANGEYSLTVQATTEVYAYYALDVARTNYAKEVIKEEYEEDFAKYIQYLADLDAYNKYTKAVAQYEEDLEDWKNTGKKGTKPVKSDYFTTKVSEPEKVDEPLSGALDEDAFQKLYEEEHFNKYWALIVQFDSEAEAQDMLLQYGVVISDNASNDTRWFHYGTTDYSSNDSDKALIAAYDFETKGSTTIITDKDYYKLLTTDNDLYDEDNSKTSTSKKGLVLATKANPDSRTGAYELTEEEIKDILVKVYNQKYQSRTSKVITTSDYDPSTGTYDNTEDSKLYYTEEELTELGLYSSGTSSNKFYSFSDSSKFEEAETYSNAIYSADKYCLFLILGKTTTPTDWEDYLGDSKYYETQIYADKKAELLEDQVSSTYTKTKCAELRYESGLIIYDATLESNYMANYTSDYKATKKSSKNVVASYKVNGEKKEITVEELWAKLSSYYGVYTTVDLVQYEWVFMEAQDAEGNLYNKYVDYQKYLTGKKLKKCILDNDEAKKLYDNVCTYVENIKYYFSAGYYESYGYPASYGWKNFITDYYATYYNVKLETVDDLRLFFINQQIITDFSADLSQVTETSWKDAYLTAAGKTLNEYINTTGVHLLIALPDVEKNEESGSTSNFVDPTNWTSEQLTAAEELYDKVLDILANVDESEVSTVLNGIASAFNDAALPLTDGTQPQVSYETANSDESIKTTHNYFTYKYEYFEDAAATPTYTIDVSKYKAMGFTLTCEDLTVTKGTMVTEFEDAVRQIWNTELAKLVKDATVTETVIYDHSFTAPEYKNYDETTNTATVVNENAGKTYLTTTYGLHVYANLTADLSAYFTTNNDGDKVFVEIPAIEYAQLYVYDLNKNSDEKFVALATLYSDYNDATEDKDEYRLSTAKENIKYAYEKLGFTETKFMELLENYCGDNAAYVSTQLATYFTSYDSENSAYTLAYADYTSSSYYHLQYMKQVLSAMAGGKVTLNTEDTEAKDKFTSYVDYFVESYNSSFSTISFLSGTKDACEDLLDAINCVNGNTAYSTVANDAVNALKAYAKTAYNNLSSEDKTELQAKATQAGILN